MRNIVVVHLREGGGGRGGGGGLQSQILKKKSVGLKGSVMHIEKALINDHFRVTKVS